MKLKYGYFVSIFFVLLLSHCSKNEEPATSDITSENDVSEKSNSATLEKVADQNEETVTSDNEKEVQQSSDQTGAEEDTEVAQTDDSVDDNDLFKVLSYCEDQVSKELNKIFLSPKKELFNILSRSGVDLERGYKLGILALELGQKCENQLSTCYMLEIENKKCDIFELAPKLKQELIRRVPSCAGVVDAILASCEE